MPRVNVTAKWTTDRRSCACRLCGGHTNGRLVVTVERFKLANCALRLPLCAWCLPGYQAAVGRCRVTAPSLTGGCRDRCGAQDLLEVIKGEPPHPVGPCLFPPRHGGRCRDEAGNWWHGINPPHRSPLGEGWPSVRIPTPPPPSCPTCDQLNGWPVQVAGDLRSPGAASESETLAAAMQLGLYKTIGALAFKMQEIGELLDLDAEHRDPEAVLAAARERIPAWRDCAGAVGGLAALLRLEPPLPSPDEVCAVAVDRVAAARQAQRVAEASAAADARDLFTAHQEQAAAEADLRIVRVELGELRSRHAVVEVELAEEQSAAQADLARILRELGLRDHARPLSCHEVVEQEVLPAIREARVA
jgi:hypothetical protein